MTSVFLNNQYKDPCALCAYKLVALSSLFINPGLYTHDCLRAQDQLFFIVYILYRSK